MTSVWVMFQRALQEDAWLRSGVAVGSVLLLTLVFRGLLQWLVSLLRRHAVKTTNRVDDFLVDLFSGTRTFFLFGVSVFLVSELLEFRPKIEKTIRVALMLLGLVQVGLWGNAAVRHFVGYRMGASQTDPAARTGSGVVTVAGMLMVWLTVTLTALDNLGVDITALIAGLGVGGVAVALATQNILGDLFASVSILLDKPFVVGDFIIVGEQLGTVEYIGVKTTRVRALSGEQVVFSNNDLLQSRIRNFKRMNERRVVLNFRVEYGTPRRTLEKLPKVLRALVEAQPNVRFDRSHFAQFGDYALNLEIVFYVLSGDYNQYMDIQQSLLLSIHEAFEKEGVRFAIPTQNLNLQTPNTRVEAEAR